MSDINVSSNVNISASIDVTPKKATNSANVKNSAAQDNSSNSTSIHDNNDKLISEEYGPVVSESKDGDTLRVKSDQDRIYEVTDAIDDSIDFDVVDFNVHSLENFEPTYSTSDTSISDNDSTNISSYAGITDSELKHMYLTGEISQMDYDLEMKSRQAWKDSIKMENSKFTNELTNDMSRKANVDNAAKSIDIIENGQTSSTIPDQIRLPALQNFDTV